MTFATADDWARFLTPVAAAVRNPPSPTDFRGRCAALAFAMRVEARDLTEARQRDLCRASEFWPSVAEVEKIFKEVWKDRARSSAIATAGGNPLLPAPPVQSLNRTPEELEAVRAAAEAFRAEMAAKQAVKMRETVTPRYLHPVHLLAEYEAMAAQGNEAAALRAAQLREALNA